MEKWHVFEEEITKRLKKNGYWAHRIAPNVAGQQPFDIVAIRGGKACAYDAKVLSSGKRFPLNRIEDNQINAFEAFTRAVYSCGTKPYNPCEVGCLILHNGEIRFLSFNHILILLDDDVKSIDVESLPIWTEGVF